MIRLRHMGVESKYSVLSVLSLSGVAALHLLHGLTAPMLMGAAAELHAGHHGSGGSPLLMEMLMLLIVAANLVSMYFAVRQLLTAIRKPGSLTKHTKLCSSVSFIVLCMGIYTMMSL